MRQLGQAALLVAVTAGLSLSPSAMAAPPAAQPESSVPRQLLPVVFMRGLPEPPDPEAVGCHGKASAIADSSQQRREQSRLLGAVDSPYTHVIFYRRAAREFRVEVLLDAGTRLSARQRHRLEAELQDTGPFDVRVGFSRGRVVFQDGRERGGGLG
jgi:hypothetical protein